MPPDFTIFLSCYYYFSNIYWHTVLFKWKWILSSYNTALYIITLFILLTNSIALWTFRFDYFNRLKDINLNLIEHCIHIILVKFTLPYPLSPLSLSGPWHLKVWWSICQIMLYQVHDVWIRPARDGRVVRDLPLWVQNQIFVHLIQFTATQNSALKLKYSEPHFVLYL